MPCPGHLSTAAACAEIMAFPRSGRPHFRRLFTAYGSCAKGRRACRKLLTHGGPLPRDWVTRESLENAVTMWQPPEARRTCCFTFPRSPMKPGSDRAEGHAKILRRTPRVTSVVRMAPISCSTYTVSEAAGRFQIAARRRVAAFGHADK